jgi:signal transduction histidine kinase
LLLEIESGDGGFVVQTDRRALRQILINLVNNAVKFTDRGTVRLSQRPGEGASAVISVTDTGVGILPEDQARLFQPFERIRPAGAAKSEGSGLGLHLSARLARLLGGSILVQSVFGEGSTFSLALPAGSGDGPQAEGDRPGE